MRISRYSLKGLRGIIGLYRIFSNVYLINTISYTFFRLHFWFFFQIWFFKVLKIRKNLKKDPLNEKNFRPVKFHFYSDFLRIFFFSWTSTLSNVSRTIPSPADVLFEWPLLCRAFPWEVLLLTGAGFALARASKASGLSVLVGGKLRVLAALPPAVGIIRIR